MRVTAPIVLFCLAWVSLPPAALAQTDSTAHQIREGNWVEVRGGLRQDGVFEGQRIEIVHGQRYQVLIGTVANEATENRISVLGRTVEFGDKTSFDGIDRSGLAGKRVKIEGYFRGVALFAAREIDPRGPGRDRLVGRVDRIAKTSESVQLEVMGFTVEVPADLELRHDDPLGDYTLSQSRTQPVALESRSEDDQFGQGIRISENLLFAGLAEVRWTGEDEFDLNRRDPEDRQDSESSFRARLVYRPSSSFVGVLEVSHRRLWRVDDEDGRLERNATVLGESYAYWMDPFKKSLDIQLGRIDFDDEREWLYDQNLDGLRLFYSWRELVAEISVSTTLSDGSPYDENTVNTILYVSNGDEEQHLAAYIIDRDTDLPIRQERTHFGLRAHGDFLDNHWSWLEISYMTARDGNVDSSGWGLDIGNTWTFDSGFNTTLGYAFGQGNNPATDSDHTFRQTGLQDNNAKFAGVTSFRYYGELADPELSNLRITTAGIGYRFKRKISIDLVGHQYVQDHLSRSLVSAEIDARPNGRNRDLGWEADLILGWRTNPAWDLEVVAAYFKPGAAFGDADSALLGKLQWRYRF